MSRISSARAGADDIAAVSELAIHCNLHKVFYGDFLAVRNSDLPIEKGQITGFIGPSGCGKSTVLRSLNRMNDLVTGFRFEGHVRFNGQDIYAKNVDPVVVRRYIGMVFQQPNPFSISIFDNVAFGLRLNRFKGDLDGKVETALRRAAVLTDRQEGRNETVTEPSSGLNLVALELPGAFDTCSVQFNSTGRKRCSSSGRLAMTVVFAALSAFASR